MVNSLLKFVVMMVFCQLAVSALREEDFRKSLDGNYPEKFLYQLLNNQIKHRAGYLTEISGQTNFSDDDYSVINATIGSVELLTYYMSKIRSSLQPTLRYKAYDNLSKIYAEILEQFNDQFISQYKSIVEIDYLNPVILSEQLKNKSGTFESVKQNALLLIDAYSYDIDFMSKYDPSDIYRTALAETCLKNLSSLRKEIESLIQLTGNSPIPTLEILLTRFDLILRHVAGKPQAG
ncbi:uncharacterized protein LOC128389380 [Panonychus citri]|uniref:uncharacterized protein LOC128389380 n=1 Tax=Panonychus citri TaxID=50023 RepID=UPI0023075BFB|nr:uncharacterized protein LOC128389380 [Panonychus citri]